MKIKELYKKIKKVLWDINCFCYRLHYNNRLLRTKNKTLRFSPTWFKYLYQDFKYGCNESDTWDITKDVYRMMLPRLKMLKKVNTISYPATIFCKDSDMCMNKWNEILDEIIWYVEERVYENEFMTIMHNQDTKKFCVYNKRNEKAKKLFYKYFNDFWW